MKNKSTSAPAAKAENGLPRAIRADAQRNRDAILAAAQEIFEEQGVLASIDGIAVRAGVGNATLYRNFPTRDDLLAAVMTTSVANTLATARNLSEWVDARKALEEWLFTLTWQLRIWHDLPYCVASAQSDPDSQMKSTSSELLNATGDLLELARMAGKASTMVTVTDLFELVTALSWAVDRFGDDEQAARRRVAIATAGVFNLLPQPLS
jgi:AcrR family transcriptional regulator